MGANVVLPFTLGTLHPLGAKQYEKALIGAEFAHGIDVVIDYLWGESAKTVIVAIAKAVDDARPVRFVHVGGASREENIELPGAALRSSAIQLMGSGIKSVPLPKLLGSIKSFLTPPARQNFRLRQRPLLYPRSKRSGTHPENHAS